MVNPVHYYLYGNYNGNNKTIVIELLTDIIYYVSCPWYQTGIISVEFNSIILILTFQRSKHYMVTLEACDRFGDYGFVFQFSNHNHKFSTFQNMHIKLLSANCSNLSEINRNLFWCFSSYIICSLLHRQLSYKYNLPKSLVIRQSLIWQHWLCMIDCVIM